jgi:O-antigen/teichoic acid export membrane protein
LSKKLKPYYKLNTRKILRNNVFLFSQIFLNIVITIFTLRIVIDSVGLEDYGIYNLVFGFVVMLSFLTAAMSFSCVRFFSYYSNKYSNKELYKVFQSTLVINFFIAIIFVFTLELVGISYIEKYINISADKIPNALIIFHLVVAISVLKIIRTSFEASIQARQDFHILSIIESLELILRFLFVIYLPFYQDDKIIFLAFSVAFVTLISTISIIIFSVLKYEEITFKNFKVERSQLTKMLSFFSWNTFGAAAGLIRDQGIAIVLNSFYGPIMNASYGISLQINATIKKFTENFLKTLKPIAYKYEGEGKRSLMMNMTYSMSKVGFYLALLIGLPLIIQITIILELWINEFTTETVIFSQLLIILILINIMSSGIQTGLQAIGEIKLYQISVGTLIITIPFLGFLFLKLNLPYYSLLLVSISIEILSTIVRIIILKRNSNFTFEDFFKKIFYPILKVTVIITSVLLPISNLIKAYDLKSLIINSFIMMVYMILVFYTIGLNKNEKLFINKIILKYAKKNRDSDVSL